VVLLEYGKSLAGSDCNITGRGFQFSGENAKEGGFTGAVSVAFRKLNVYFLKKSFFPETQGYIVC